MSIPGRPLGSAKAGRRGRSPYLSRKRTSWRPTLEALEARWVPSVSTTTQLTAIPTLTYGSDATFTVTVSADSGSTAPSGTVEVDEVDSSGTVLSQVASIDSASSSGAAATFTPFTGALSVGAGSRYLAAFFTPTDSTAFDASSTTPSAVTVGAAAPTVYATALGGIYTGSAYGATGTVLGVNGDGFLATDDPDNGSALDPTTLSYTYYSATVDSGGNWTAGTQLGGAPAGAGTYAAVAHYTSDNANYANADSATTFFAITPAALTVTADDKAITYGDTPQFTVSYSGFVNGEDQSVLGGTLSFSGDATTAKNVGTYTITPGGLTSNNYSITFANGKLTIGQKALTVTADNKEITYGDALPTFTASYSGFITGEDPSVLGGALTFSGNATTARNAGSYTITPGGLTSSNYAITFNNGALKIDPKALTVTADNQEITYGDALPTFTASYSGFVNGDTASALGGTLAFSGNATTAKNVGTYTITPGGLTSSNYSITFDNGTLKIDPKALTVTADNQEITYGDSLPTFTASYSGFITGEDPSVLGGALTFSGNATTAKNAGTYTITPGGLTSSNYAITFANGALKIDPKALTVTADDKAITYGDALPTFTASYGGFVTGEDPSVLGGTLSFSGSATTAKNAGTYTITPGGLTSGNYAISYVDGKLTIGEKALTVTADDKASTYGDALPTFTVSYNGFAGTDGPGSLGGTLAFSGSATTATGAGTYTIIPGGLTSGNYAISFASGTLQIAKANALLQVNEYTGTYDGAAHGLGGTATGVKGENLTGLLNLGGTQTAAGEYTVAWSFAGNGNYNAAAGTSGIDIARRALTVRATGLDKVYDGTTAAAVTLSDDRVPGDPLTVSYASASFADKDVGVGKTVTVLGITVSGPVAANYTFNTTAQTTADILPRPGATFGVFDPATATWYLRGQATAGAPTVAPFSYGMPNWIPVFGDWNGDGTATVGVVDPATMTWYLRNSNSPGAPDIVFQYGSPGMIPVVGDWDGNGTATAGVLDPTTEIWYLRNSNSPGAPSVTPFSYGTPGWTPVVGDWDGNGTATVGVMDPATETWYLRNSNGPGAADLKFQFGMPGWTPVAADWDGNGTTTVGAVNPGTETWYLRNSNSSGAPDVAPFPYGNPGWVPLPGGGQSIATLRVQGAAPAQPAAALISELQATVDAALMRLTAAGVQPELLRQLAAAQYTISRLSDAQLGLAVAGANRVIMDATAAGQGWFVDPTPLTDEEFSTGGPGQPEVALPGGPAAGRMDLLTAVLHEMGHLAGLPDDAGASGDLMAAVLNPGTRVTQGLASVFAPHQNP